MLIQLLIPKTGSTTFSEILQGKFSFHEVCYWNSDGEIQEYNDRAAKMGGRPSTAGDAPFSHCGEKGAKLMTGGHYVFGVHEYIPGRHSYVTMLRDPVERILSDYYYFKRLGPEYAKYCGATLADHIDKYPENIQTFYLAGEKSSQMLDVARKHLESSFLFVGITEYFEKSIALLSTLMGWKPKRYLKLNTTVGRKKKSNIDPLLVRRIEEKHHLDMILYKEQLAAFRQRVAANAKEIQEFADVNVGLNQSFESIFKQIQQNRLSQDGLSYCERYRKIVFFGASGGFRKELEKIRNHVHCCEVMLVDTDKKKWGTKVAGYRVDSPENMSSYSPDCVVITSTMIQSVFDYLTEYQLRKDVRLKIFLADHVQSLISH